MYTRIQGVGSYLPQHVITNADLEEMVATSDEWIMKRVGIRERHVVKNSGDNSTSMAVAASELAIERAGIDRDVIDLVIVATATSEYYFPSTACLVQSALGLKRDVPAFDLNAACAGFVYGISVADQYIRTGMARTVLVVGVDALSKVVNWEDRSTCVLFGDGAGAVILQADEKPGILKTVLHANGDFAPLITAESAIWSQAPLSQRLQMRGNEVFKTAVIKLGEIVDEMLKASGMEKSQIDWLIPHQANLRIITAIAARLDLPLEQVILTIEKHGNTSAASIPLALDVGIQEGRVKRGQLLLLEGLGAGFTWGAALVKY